MRSGALSNVFIALAILLAQWAGYAQGIEHPFNKPFSAAHTHSVIAQNTDGEDTISPHSSDLAHSCLSFDAATSVYTPIASPIGSVAKPVLLALPKWRAQPIDHPTTLICAHVRVRGPPHTS